MPYKRQYFSVGEGGMLVGYHQDPISGVTWKWDMLFHFQLFFENEFENALTL